METVSLIDLFASVHLSRILLTLEIVTDQSVIEATKESYRLAEVSLKSVKLPSRRIIDQDFLSRTIKSLSWPERLVNLLKCHSIETVGDLVRYSSDQLLRFNGIGPLSLYHIRECLGEKGLRLKDD